MFDREECDDCEALACMSDHTGAMGPGHCDKGDIHVRSQTADQVERRRSEETV